VYKCIREKKEQKVYYIVFLYKNAIFIKKRIERCRCFFNLIVNILFFSSALLRIETRTNMIPVLRSIDGLLNRFDELSQRHTTLISKFDTNFTDIENPLHDVSRTEDEQRKTVDDLLKITIEDDDQLGSGGAVEDFNRRIIKSRCPNRPPSYSSNEISSVFHRIPSRSSWRTTESAPLPQTSTIAITEETIKTNNSQKILSISSDNLIEKSTRITTKFKPKVLLQNPPLTRRPARSAITTFTKETAIRLSRPRAYHRSPEQKTSPKRVHRRPRPFHTVKKEVGESSSITPIQLPPPPPPPISQPKPTQSKRTNPAIIKSSPKKLKAGNRPVTDNSKRSPMSNYPRPTFFLAAPPTICLTFPTQPHLRSSRVVVIPKANTLTPLPPKKPISFFTNERSMIPPNRMIYLMT
jgi:hypothetical protein